jgi:cellulose synthase/poly-beta-1,6-N-acetylglucosamine synthase-like glycosyltransferase
MSVLREVRQASCEAEIIVVNNASTDNTSEIARSLCGVTVIDESRRGLSRARQAGFDVSTGVLVANVDADTVLPPGWLLTVLNEFRQNPMLVALSGPFVYQDLTFVKRGVVRCFYYLAWVVHVVCHRIFRKGAVLQGGNFVLRRTALEQIGGYDARFTFYGEDTDIARRIQNCGDVKFTFALPMNTIARRFKKEGFCKMGVKYAINYFWTMILKRPFTTTSIDIR